ncbi:unnamed protein product [Didymodactylos carnosus]|nr:unnamed protein product [Didymodactylos carnosus]CAF4222152.1 unnamed protein product [Didymodactylos carnosus]
MANSSSVIAQLNYLSLQVNRYLPIPLFILGSIGSTLNVLIFTRKSLKTNSCTKYFLASTTANFFVIYFVILLRILSDGYGIDPSIYSNEFCKIRYYITYTARSLSSWFIVLACVDRFASSCQTAKYRKFSTVPIAYFSIATATLLGFLSYLHVPLLFGVQYTTNGIPSCYALTGPYRIFADLFYTVCYAAVPPIIMITFGILIVLNIKNTHRQITPAMSTGVIGNRRKDHHFMIMLLFQVGTIFVFTMPIAI